MTDLWITTQESSDISGYHPEHIRRLIRQGRVLAQKFGPVWQVSRKSLQTYLDEAEKREDRRWGPQER